MARLNIRFKTVSSRLISPAETDLRTSGTSCHVPFRFLTRLAGRARYVSAIRFAMYARMSLAVIDDSRLFPKNGARCLLIRRLASTYVRLRFAL
jgi:hypothetical protein